jgi:hypothetical protein
MCLGAEQNPLATVVTLLPSPPPFTSLPLYITPYHPTGRLVMRLAWEHPEVEIVHVNDLGSLDSSAYLLKVCMCSCARRRRRAATAPPPRRRRRRRLLSLLFAVSVPPPTLFLPFFCCRSCLL